MIGVILGWVIELVISFLFSPGEHNGLFLPNKKSHAFSIKLWLKKYSNPTYDFSFFSSSISSSMKHCNISKKLSNFVQFLAALVFSIEKHLSMNLVHTAFGYSIPDYSIVLAFSNSLTIVSFSSSFNCFKIYLRRLAIFNLARLSGHSSNKSIK